VIDPLSGSQWSQPGVVAGFSTSVPNQSLLQYAQHVNPARILDIGCGAGRNAVPLALNGRDVIGTDLSWPMLQAAASRDSGQRLHVVLAPMQQLPIRERSIDLVIAHGIWNLARSAAEFRAAVREAARVSKPGSALFVFTFSRNTLPPDAEPVNGERIVYTQFSGSPQIFLTREQLLDEMREAGFEPDPDFPLREHNLPPPGQQRLGGPPVIYEAAFRFRE
jgi:ubiquinone/menaquinone biosynthesis C-methylase UbiE